VNLTIVRNVLDIDVPRLLTELAEYEAENR
jgi:hypothetical protein